MRAEETAETGRENDSNGRARRLPGWQGIMIALITALGAALGGGGTYLYQQQAGGPRAGTDGIERILDDRLSAVQALSSSHLAQVTKELDKQIDGMRELRSGIGLLMERCAQVHAQDKARERELQELRVAQQELRQWMLRHIERAPRDYTPPDR